MKNYYAVGIVTEKMDVEVAGKVVSMKMSWADKMIGVIPVFKTLRAAKNFMGDKEDVKIIKIRCRR